MSNSIDNSLNFFILLVNTDGTIDAGSASSILSIESYDLSSIGVPPMSTAYFTTVQRTLRDTKKREYINALFFYPEGGLFQHMVRTRWGSRYDRTDYGNGFVQLYSAETLGFGQIRESAHTDANCAECALAT